MLSVCLFAAAVLLAPRVAASSEQATIEELKAQVPTKNAAEKLALDTAITFLAGADTKMALELLQQLLRSDSSQVMSQVISRRGMFEAFHMSNIRHSGLYEDCPEALAHVKESLRLAMADYKLDDSTRNWFQHGVDGIMTKWTRQSVLEKRSHVFAMPNGELLFIVVFGQRHADHTIHLGYGVASCSFKLAGDIAVMQMSSSDWFGSDSWVEFHNFPAVIDIPTLLAIANVAVDAMNFIGEHTMIGKSEL